MRFVVVAYLLWRIARSGRPFMLARSWCGDGFVCWLADPPGSGVGRFVHGTPVFGTTLIECLRSTIRVLRYDAAQTRGHR